MLASSHRRPGAAACLRLTIRPPPPHSPSFHSPCTVHSPSCHCLFTAFECPFTVFYLAFASRPGKFFMLTVRNGGGDRYNVRTRESVRVAALPPRPQPLSTPVEGPPPPLLSSHSTHFLFFRVQSSEHPASSHCLCRSPGLTSTTRPRRCSELQSEQATGSRLLGAPPEHGCSSEAALRLRLLGGGRGEKAVGWQRLAGNIVHTACEVTTEFTDVSWYHNMVCTLLWPQSGQHNFSQ